MNIIKYIICLSFITTASVSANIIGPALPTIAQDYHLAHGQSGLVMVVFLIGYVFGQLIYGPLANRFGSISALRYGLGLNIIGILLCMIPAKHAAYSVLLIGRMITALGASAGLACTFMLLKERLSAAAHKRSLSHITIAFAAGIGLSTMLGGLVTHMHHWRYTFWILLAIGLVLFVCTWAYKETQIVKQPLGVKTIFNNYKNAFSNFNLVSASMCVGFSTSINYCYATAAPAITKMLFHLNPAQYGMINWVNVIAMLAMGLIGAKIMHKAGINKSIISSMLLAGPCILSLALLASSAHQNVFWFFASTMVLFFITRLAYSSGAYIATHSITDTASASSAMSFINLGTSTVLVTIMGYLHFSRLLSFTISVAGFYIIALICILIAMLKKSRPQAH
jgi:MFS transporter, DHA1 family, multidrug resistance protein